MSNEVHFHVSMCVKAKVFAIGVKKGLLKCMSLPLFC